MVGAMAFKRRERSRLRAQRVGMCETGRLFDWIPVTGGEYAAQGQVPGRFMTHLHDTRVLAK
jgi:hypothetical protein